MIPTFIVRRLSAKGYTKRDINEKFGTNELFWLNEENDNAYKEGKAIYVSRVLEDAVREGLIIKEPYKKKYNGKY